MESGKVKWFNTVKQFGFITDGNGKDIFIHKKDVPEGVSIDQGDMVEFDLAQTPKGPKAVNLIKL